MLNLDYSRVPVNNDDQWLNIGVCSTTQVKV